MSCSGFRRNMRSAQTAYNDVPQAFVATGTPIAILGTTAADTGTAIVTKPTAFEIGSTGLYRISYDIDLTAGAAGIVRVQLYNGMTPLPCSVAARTVATDLEYAIHVETTLVLIACCGIQPNISAQVSGVAGTVTHVCANCTKLS